MNNSHLKTRRDPVSNKTGSQHAIHCLLAGFLAISSCTAPGPDPSVSGVSTETLCDLPNSERIPQEFGSYGTDVVRHDAQLRVSNLYSLEAGRKITRTLAVHIDQVWVSKNSMRLRYVSIAEVHHPDYLDLNQSRQIYGVAVA
jgi:hypothetical protein